jgi:hypothetical protein
MMQRFVWHKGMSDDCSILGNKSAPRSPNKAVSFFNSSSYDMCSQFGAFGKNWFCRKSAIGQGDPSPCDINSHSSSQA